MKKLVFVLALGAFAACGGGASDNSNGTDTTKANVETAVKNADSAAKAAVDTAAKKVDSAAKTAVDTAKAKAAK
ncbi:MAG: hypothetical protein LBE82_02960 [Chitinophagaceae bacterium]|jgi:hypothetical protein|nr:hypothetical protein [Chitinophagaceae bacterium]